jgi:alpha-glucosidase
MGMVSTHLVKRPVVLLMLTSRLGAFNTFYRNHNELGNIAQEFYRWPITTEAAVAAGKTRLRLIDYIYSFLHQQHVDGTPAMWPLSWVHPEDENTVGIESQFYFGPALLVSPVTAENSTTATFYVPSEVYYDFFNLSVVQGEGAEVTVEDVGYDTIPLHIRGGSILPLRTGDANTTEQNRELPFNLVVAPNSTDQAWGYLRLDDGISLDPGDSASDIWMIYGNDTLEVSGSFGYGQGNILDLIVFAGQTENRTISINGELAQNIDFDSDAQTLTAYNLDLPFAAMNITLSPASNDGSTGSSSSSVSVSSTASTTATASQSSITGSVTTQAEPTVTSAAASISEAVAASVSAALSDLAGAEPASPSASA